MGIRDVKMLFAKRKKGIFSQKTTLLGFFLEDNSGQHGTTKDNIFLINEIIKLSQVVLCCPVLSSKILPLQKFYPISFSFQASPDRAGMGTRPYDNRHFKNLVLLPKYLVFFVFFRSFRCPKNSISSKFLPQKRGSELLKSLVF
jgi:hypothetical protein